MRSYRESSTHLETREPEKTPLIDMVFLLLVFFFVNLSVRTVSHQPKQQSRLQADVKRSFLRVPNPASYDENNVVLIEILDAAVPSTRNRLVALRSRIQNCASSVGCPISPIPPVGIGPGLQRFWVATVPLDVLESRASSWGTNCPGCAELQAARQDFPIPWQGGNNMAALLQARLPAAGGLVAGGAKQLHVRVPKTFPAAELLQCLYELVQSTPGLEQDMVYVRALEEKM